MNDAQDLSWYPRKKYLYNGMEVRKVEIQNMISGATELFGTTCSWKVTDNNGKIHYGQSQRGGFSGFLKSNNILPAWLDDGQDPAELAQEWEFVCTVGMAHINSGHACFVPKEDPQLADPAKVQIFSIAIASGTVQGERVVVNATAMSGEEFEVAVHDLETPMRSVALAIKKQRSLPADWTIKLVTQAGELLRDADMLSIALAGSSNRPEHVCKAEAPQYGAQGEHCLEVRSDDSVDTAAFTPQVDLRTIGLYETLLEIERELHEAHPELKKSEVRIDEAYLALKKLPWVIGYR